MLFIIWLITIVLFLVSIGCILHNLGTIDKRIKIIFILIGFAIMFFITLIVCNISSNEVNYKIPEMQNDVSKMLILIFTPLNALFTIPWIAKIISRINDNDIEKNQVIKRVVAIIIVFIIVLIIECSYLKNTQLGIIEIYEKMK